MAKLILMRHGECVWHSKHVFTGWFDVPLSSNGIIEALKSGAKISEIEFDIVVTSMQIRAIEAVMIALTQNKSKKMPVLISDNKKMEEWITTNSKSMEGSIIPVFSNWHLNEQCELPGRDKVATTEKYGVEHLSKWCYNYDQPLENTECLKDTAKRTIPFFRDEIVPQLENNKNVLISAHNNSLRLIVMFVEKCTEKEIYTVEIPTYKPFMYEIVNGKIITTKI